jgi:hypothetical protein
MDEGEKCGDEKVATAKDGFHDAELNQNRVEGQFKTRRN